MSHRLVIWAAFILAACSSGPADPLGGDTLEKGSRVHMMPPRNRVLQPPSVAPHFQYYGGPVLANVKIVEILWGPDVRFGADLGRFYSALVGSEYFDLLAEYRTPAVEIGHGAFLGLITDLAPPIGTLIDDTTIQTELGRLIHDHTIPENDTNTLYVVHLPPGATVTQSGASSCENFCAYHGTFRRNNQLVPYAVVPDMGGACEASCGSGGDTLATTTWIASHELVQAVTNPAVGFGPKEPAAPIAWFDPEYGELSDACAGTAQIAGFVVQTQWSGVDAKCRFGSSATGTFAIGVSPRQQMVRAGTAATLVVTTVQTNAEPAMIALSASGLPPNVTASFEPSSVLAGRTAVLTLTAAADAAGAMMDLTVTGANGDERQSTTAHLTVEGQKPANDFLLAVTPVTQTLERGQSVKFTATTVLASGTAESVVFSVTGLPSGVTAVFAPSSVTAGGSAELTLAASASARVGSGLVTVSATARSKMRSATLSLDVQEKPPTNDFVIGVGPAAATVEAGKQTAFNITTAITSGSAQSIQLAVLGLPAGVTASFSPATITAGSGSVLTITASASAAPVIAPFTISGVAASGMHTTTATVTVVAAPPVDDFTVGLTPSSRTIQAGSSNTFAVTTGVASGHAVPIAFAISGLPAGVTASFEPSSVTAGQSATLTVRAALSAAQTTAQLTVTGASTTGNHSATASVTITAPPPSDFAIAVTPPSQSMTRGTKATYVVSTNAVSGAPQTINLVASGLPVGVTAGFAPPTVTTGEMSTLTLTAAGDAALGTDSFTVQGSASGATHTASAQVTVIAPPIDDFMLTVTPDSTTVAAGGTRSVTVTSAVTSGSAQVIALMVTGLPSGVTGTFQPSAISAGTSATLTFSANPSVQAASVTYTVSGTAASGTRVAMGDLTVTPAPVTDLIENGDFESDALSPWIVDGGAASISTLAHHGGSSSARVGTTTDLWLDSGLYQEIAVPSTGTTTAEMWIYSRCQDIYPYNRQTIYVVDAATGIPLRTVFDGCTDNATWTKLTTELTTFKGDSVLIYFRVRAQGGLGATWLYVDDVVVTNQ